MILFKFGSMLIIVIVVTKYQLDKTDFNIKH